MDLSHNSRPLVCLPWAKIIAVSKESPRAAAVWGWFIVSLDGYLLRLHHKGCKIERSCERFPLPPYCIVFFLWSVFTARCPVSCSWTAVVSSGTATGATGSLMFDKVNQVNWLFCGRGIAWVDVWFDFYPLQSSSYVCSDDMQLSSGFVALPHSHCCAVRGSNNASF